MLSVGQELRSDYRVTELGEQGLWYGVRLVDGGEVAGVPEQTAGGATWARAVGLEHPHLAAVHGPLEDEQQRWLVVQRLRGEPLSRRLARDGKLLPVDAVRAGLRLVDAVSKLHERGAIHGALSADSVLVDVAGFTDPVLSFQPGEAPSAWPPEHVAGSAPTEADDAWGVAALLHQLLVGQPVTPLGLASAAELASLGFKDAALSEALVHALRTRAQDRSTLRDLKRALAHWFVEHASDEPSVLSRLNVTIPPPLPPALPPEASTPPPPTVSSATPPRPSQTPPPPARRGRLPLVAGLALTLGLGGAWLFSQRSSTTPLEPTASASATASLARTPAPASAAAIDVPEIPLVASQDAATGDERATCVAGYLPPGAFRSTSSLDFLCSEADVVKGTKLLEAAIVRGGAGGHPTAAMRLFSQLEWYELAVYATVRQGCCVDAAPLTAPTPSPGCPPMAAPLQALGKKLVEDPHELGPLLEAFTTAADCEFAAGQGAAYGRVGKLGASERVAFTEYTAKLTR